MAHRTTLAKAAASASLDAITALLDAAGKPGRLVIFTGRQPKTPDDRPEDAVEVAAVELNAVAFKPSTPLDNGAIAECSSMPVKIRAQASGKASWFRAYDGDGRPVIDGSVGTAGADMVLDTTNIVENQQIELANWSLAMGQM